MNYIFYPMNFISKYYMNCNIVRVIFCYDCVGGRSLLIDCVCGNNLFVMIVCADAISALAPGGECEDSAFGSVFLCLSLCSRA